MTMLWFLAISNGKERIEEYWGPLRHAVTPEETFEQFLSLGLAGAAWRKDLRRNPRP